MQLLSVLFHCSAVVDTDSSDLVSSLHALVLPSVCASPMVLSHAAAAACRDDCAGRAAIVDACMLKLLAGVGQLQRYSKVPPVPGACWCCS